MELHVVDSEQEWLELRQTVITATESACLVGVNPYSSMQKAWNDKIHGNFSGNAYTLVGQLLEQIVVDVTNIVMKEDFHLFEVDETKHFYIDEDARLGATPDAFNDTMLLECKTTKPANFLRYRLSPPPIYLAQVMTQLHVTELDEAYLSILSTDLSPEGPEDTLPIAIFKVKKNKRACELLVQEAKRFWECQENEKAFRVDSAVKKEMQLLLQMSYTKVV